MKYFGCSLVLAGALVSPAVACDLCSVYSAARAGTGSGQGLFAGLAEQYTHFGTLQDEGHEIPGIGEHINSSVSQVFAGYNFNDRFGLQLNLPIIYRSFSSGSAKDSESGIGDMSLIASWLAWEKYDDNYTIDWSVHGGIKFPTGNSSRLGEPDFSTHIAGHDLALGSGSYDGVIGTDIYGSWKRLFATASVQYAIRTEGDFDHQYANDLTWSGGPGIVLCLSTNYSLSLQAVVTGEYKGMDTFSGVPDDDSAETLVAVGPQLNFNWSYRLSAQAGVDLPVSIYNSGEQLVPSYRIRGAMTWRF